MTEEKQKTESNASPELVIGRFETTTVNWLIKGTLAVVTVRVPSRPYPEAMFLMGPDGHSLAGKGQRVWDDHQLENQRLAWMHHPDTAAEAREAWLAAGGKS